MTVVHILLLRWRRWYTGQQQLLRIATLALCVVYIGGSVGWIGLSFPYVLDMSGAKRPPIRLLNDHLLSLFGGLLVARFVFQRYIGNSWQACLALPVRRTTLALAMQVTAAASMFNVLAIVGVVVLAISTIAPNTSVESTATWMISTLLMVGITHFAHILLRTNWIRQAWGSVFGTGVIVAVLVGADIYEITLVREVSAWFFAGPMRGKFLPLLILASGMVGLSIASTASLHRYTYSLIRGEGQQHHWTAVGVRGHGMLLSLILLEGQLILRNRGPREHILAGLGGVGFLVFMIVGGATRSFSVGIAPFLLGTLLPISHGQFVFAWHGSYFDALLTNVSPRQLVNATLLILGGLAVGPMLLSIPAVVLAEPFSVVPIGAFALYHVGVTCPVVMWAGLLWNRTWVNPEQSRFTTSGGSIRGVAISTALAVPPLLLSLTGELTIFLIGVAGLGLAGLGTMSIWLPRLERELWRRRYAMLRGFRGSWLSPYSWQW